MRLLWLALILAGDLASQAVSDWPSDSAGSAAFPAVMPDADAFVPAAGDLPYHLAYAEDPAGGGRRLVGFIFLTQEVVPDEVAYASRIETLVGMTADGVITGVRILDHAEPYGYFSIDEPEFARQFAGRSILDRLRVGEDIDSVTRATITVEGATRAIRKAARLVAREHLRETQGQ